MWFLSCSVPHTLFWVERCFVGWRSIFGVCCCAWNYTQLDGKFGHKQDLGTFLVSVSNWEYFWSGYFMWCTCCVMCIAILQYVCLEVDVWRTVLLNVQVHWVFSIAGPRLWNSQLPDLKLVIQPVQFIFSSENGFIWSETRQRSVSCV